MIPSTKKPSTLAVKPVVSSHLSILDKASLSVNEGLAQLAKLVSGDVTPELAVRAYQLVSKDWLKAMEDIKGAMRNALQAMVVETGVLQPSEGTSENLVTEVAGVQVVQQTSYKKLPNLEKLSAILSNRGLKISDACDQTIVYTPNPDKLKALVLTKKLKPSDLLECRDVHQVSLKVKE